MTTRVSALLGAVSVAALFGPTPTLAQSQPQSDQTATVDDIVVTGTRVQGRSRFDTLAPVDVVTSETLQQRGTTEFAAALAQSIPSVNFPRASLVDGTDSVRPATLRGLQPDQTLVLVNGVRRHASALVNVNGSVGRGSAAVDLNAVPSGALDRIEVLRDGASAQYGSDAIAGVVNLRLKEARQGGGASVTYGQYDTTVETARQKRDESDGATTTVSLWQGLPLGDEGFLTVSAEYLNRDHTNRSDLDPTVTPNAVTGRIGDPDVEQWTVFANAGLPLSNGWEAYGWGGYQNRDSQSAAFPRQPGHPNYIPNHPAFASDPDYATLGFLPKIGVESKDASVAAGVRGELGGWRTDFNVGYGRNALEFSVHDTINASYGTALNQRDFYAGELIYSQLTYGVDLSRDFDIGRSDPLTLSWGVEGRHETYEVGAGEPTSWNYNGATPIPSVTTSGAFLGGGAQGFGGFRPSDEVSEDRDSYGAYADVEIPFTDRWQFAGAVRWEDYSDFGSVATGKLSTRYEFSPAFALRGTISSGFRAPSLQQQYFTYTSSTVVNGQVLQILTTPSTSAVAQALGARDLKPETSVNYSAGAVFRWGAFDLTVDAYRIELEDQIALSENINKAALPAPLQALLNGINIDLSGARFFLNGVDTVTKGVDVVGRYRLPTETVGDFDFTLAANFNDTKVVAVPTSGTLPPAVALFGRNRILTIEEGAPAEKIVGSADWDLGRWGATFRATYYGDVNQPGSAPANDLHTGDKTVLDLEGRVKLTSAATFAVGADNLLDEYPDYAPANLNSNGLIGFPFYSPFGFNGRYLYARLSLNW